MAQHTLYAYVEGSDLDGVADEIERRLVRFVASREWRCQDVWVVNQRHPPDESLKAGDLPDWELGLNVELPDSPSEPNGWFNDMEAIARFLAELHRATGRNFVIGICDSSAGTSEDLFTVDSNEPDLVELRSIIGVREAE